MARGIASMEDRESVDLASIAAYLLRFAILVVTAAAVLAADVWTKEADHAAVLLHYRHITPFEFVAVGLFLFALAPLPLESACSGSRPTFWRALWQRW